MRLKYYRERFFPVFKIQQEKILEQDRLPLVLFFCTILIYISFMVIVQPYWVLSGEMWAEMATNYYPNANASSISQKLLSTDAGYIPAPQRIIALIGNQLNLSASIIPYFYTWSGIIFTGALVGVFCLPQFRKLIKSDSLRFFTAISVLLVADFETRTFINFSYFSAFFVAIITALALVDDSEEVPWWSWLIPIFMVSKPAVLSVLPIMILVALVSRSRFRWIVLLTVLLCIGQIIQMFINSMTAITPFQPTDITFTAKILATVQYFLGFLGGYTTGHSVQIHQFILILIGLFVLFWCGYLVTTKKSSSNALIVVGLSLLFFNVFLNTFALSTSWNLDMSMLQGIPVYRHIIVGFFGCILIVCGVIGTVTNNNSSNSFFLFKGRVGTLLFVIWLVACNWLSYGIRISKEPNSPTFNSSQWQIMANNIDAGVSPLCVPINPWWKDANWMYKRNCDLLKPAPAWENGSYHVNENLTYKIIPPSDLFSKTLVSTAVLLKPQNSNLSFIKVQMHIQLKNGGIRHFSGSKEISRSGGLLLLVGEDPITIKNIAFITLKFNVPVIVALATQEPADLPGLAWMGY